VAGCWGCGLVGWSVTWLAGWLAGLLVRGLMRLFLPSEVDCWLVGHWVGHLVGWLVGWFLGSALRVCVFGWSLVRAGLMVAGWLMEGCWMFVESLGCLAAWLLVGLSSDGRRLVVGVLFV